MSDEIAYFVEVPVGMYILVSVIALYIFFKIFDKLEESDKNRKMLWCALKFGVVFDLILLLIFALKEIFSSRVFGVLPYGFMTPILIVGLTLGVYYFMKIAVLNYYCQRFRKDLLSLIIISILLAYLILAVFYLELKMFFILSLSVFVFIIVDIRDIREKIGKSSLREAIIFTVFVIFASVLFAITLKQVIFQKVSFGDEYLAKSLIKSQIHEITAHNQTYLFFYNPFTTFQCCIDIYNVKTSEIINVTCVKPRESVKLILGKNSRFNITCSGVSVNSPEIKP